MRYLFILFALFIVSSVCAQEIERPSSSTYNIFSKDINKVNYSYWDYTGVAADLLIETTSDTIDIRYHVKKHRPYTAKLISKFNPILLADTTVSIALLGRNSTDEDWTSITSTTSDAVTTDGVVASLNSATAPTFTATIAAYTMLVDTTGLSGYPADSISVPQQTLSFAQTSTLLEYRYLLARYIISGDDATGTGIELVRSELKLVEH